MTSKKQNGCCQQNCQEAQECAGQGSAQAPVCKKEMAILQLLAQQNQPPPLEINFRVGVPKANKKCAFEDESPSRNDRKDKKTIDGRKKSNTTNLESPSLGAVMSKKNLDNKKQ